MFGKIAIENLLKVFNHYKKYRNFYLILIIFIVFILTEKIKDQSFKNIPETNNFKLFPSPTPMPFYDMTITYLRGREYKSKLKNQTYAYETPSYRAYLTSYDSDNLNINGLLTIPKSEKPKKGYPAIVFIHGYIPPSSYQTLGQAYSSYVDYLANQGFVVFKIDLRGHGNSDGDPGGAYYSSDYVIDTLNAYAALQSANFVNKDAIGLWGHSMAGNVLLRALVAKKDIPAAVIWAGAVYSYSDWQKYRIQDNSYRPPQMSLDRQKRRQKLFDTYGEFTPKSFFWRQVAPTNYLNDLKGAIQIHHAVDDDVVNIGYSKDLVKLLDKTSIPYEFYEYKEGGHNISGKSFSLAMQRTVDFFQKYLINND